MSTAVAIIPGMRFGRLMTIKRMENDKQKHQWWQVQCDCGTVKTVRVSHVKNGNTSSCGCLSRGKSRR